MRPSNEHERNLLKSATRRALNQVGTADAFSQETRVQAPALSKYAANHEHSSFIPIDVALDLDRAAGTPAILTEFAALQGYGLVASSGKSRAQPCVSMIGPIIRTTGDVSAVTLDALADGKLTPNERNAIVSEIDEAMAALSVLRNAVTTELSDALKG